LNPVFFGILKLQRQLLGDLIDNFLPGTTPSGGEVLDQMKRWLIKGVDVPTAMQSGDGWHKQFKDFAVEGDGGSIHIQRIIRLHGLKQKRKGVDLDDPTWKTHLTKSVPPTKPPTP